MQRAEIEHRVPDRYPTAKALAASRPAKYRERQILQREIIAGSIGTRHPAPQCRVVRGVEPAHRRDRLRTRFLAAPRDASPLADEPALRSAATGALRGSACAEDGGANRLCR